MSLKGRTSLFSSVSKWMNQAHQENVRDGMSRRSFVKSAAAASVGIGLLGLPGTSKASTGASPRIVIVGAGIAGLIAADKLTRAGFSPSVYEGSNRVGGRMWSGRNIMGSNLITEIGGEFIDSGHKVMRRLAKRFNLDLIDVQAPSEDGLVEAFHFGGRKRTEAEIIAAFRPIAARIADHQNDIILNDYTDFNQLAFDLDNTALDDYLVQVGATGWLRDLLDVAYLTEYGCETSQQSALNLIYLIDTDLNDGFSEFGESDQRYKVTGGNDQITSALANALDRPVKTGHKLTAVCKVGTSYCCTFSTSSGSEVVDADVLLLAIPFSTLRHVCLNLTLPNVVRRYINECGYGTNSKLVLGFNSPYWRSQGYGGLNFNDMEIQSGWDSSQLQGASSATLTIFTGGNEGVEVGTGSVAFQRNKAMAQVEKLFPGAYTHSNGRAFRFHWPSYEWSKGSYTCFSPGQYTSFVGAAQPVGNLFFAGEHLSFDYQGYMEGGAVTGLEAATGMLQVVRNW